MARSVGRPSVRSDGDENPGGVLGRGASQETCQREDNACSSRQRRRSLIKILYVHVLRRLYLCTCSYMYVYTLYAFYLLYYMYM